jgi:carboxypeptidase PM20D1
MRTTTAATMFDGGVKENVLPTSARAVVNFRILPGETTQSVLKRVREVIDDPRVQIEPVSRHVFKSEPSPVSDTSSASFDLIASTVRQVWADEDVVVAPFLVLGGTDSRHYQPLADNVYRFMPFTLSPEDVPRIHGTDERIPLEAYAALIRFYVQLLSNVEESREVEL